MIRPTIASMSATAVAVLAVAVAAVARPPARPAAPVSTVDETGRASAPWRPPSDLPLDHWAYPHLRRLVARGVLELDLTTLPVSRAAVADALRARFARSRDGAAKSLSARERWVLSRLEAEFFRHEVDWPGVVGRHGDSSVGLGLLLGAELVSDWRRGDGGSGWSNETTGSVDVAYELWGGSPEVGFYTDALVLLGGQEGPRIEELGSRARTWRGIAATVDRAYVKFERPHLTVAVGRRGAAWGRSNRGRLLLSGTAPTLDCLEARFSVGRWSFEGLHALLERRETEVSDARGEDSENVFLGAHRVVVAGPWGSVGVSEAVVYTDEIPDPAYLNPLLPYYVSQHNERADDNVLWSLDFVARPMSGLEVYGELLVDDLQYERDTGHPDKYGGTVGVAYFGTAGGLDLEAGIEYTNVRKWTYTHHILEHRFTHDGRPLGFELGPDADRVSAEIVFHPGRYWSVSVTHAHTRKGEGTVTEPFEEGENPEPTFPSGDVATTDRGEIGVAYDNLAGFSASLGLALERTEGGPDEGSGVELRGSLRFRI